MASDHPPPGTSFASFGRMPVELKLQVWEQYMLDIDVVHCAPSITRVQIPAEETNDGEAKVRVHIKFVLLSTISFASMRVSSATRAQTIRSMNALKLGDGEYFSSRIVVIQKFRALHSVYLNRKVYSRVTIDVPVGFEHLAIKSTEYNIEKKLERGLVIDLGPFGLHNRDHPLFDLFKLFPDLRKLDLVITRKDAEGRSIEEPLPAKLILAVEGTVKAPVYQQELRTELLISYSRASKQISALRRQFRRLKLETMQWEIKEEDAYEAADNAAVNATDNAAV